MEISPSLTITVLDATGLPSLLSFEADSLLPSLDLPGAPAEDQSQSQLPQSFDAVLAMFVLPQILPQPDDERRLP